MQPDGDRDVGATITYSAFSELKWKIKQDTCISRLNICHFNISELKILSGCYIKHK